MKNISKILMALAAISLGLLVGCGGGSGGGSSEEVIKVTSEATVISDDIMEFTITADSKYEILSVVFPNGYTVSQLNETNRYKVTGPIIPNSGASTIKKTFNFSYIYDGEHKTASVSVSIPPNGVSTDVEVISPVQKRGDAYLLKYKSSDHLISVDVELDASLKNEKLYFVWHKDAEDGTIISNSDSVYDNAEFIYRPIDTSVIPADVTTGISREYNRGFKINASLENHNIYLVIKTGKGEKLGTVKFYVDKPENPPIPNN